MNEEIREDIMTAMNKAVETFENKMADYIGVKYAVAVNSGTSALHLILRALNIKEGDEVITTPFSFIASANSILFDNAKPVFIDIDPVTLNIDADRIKERITGKTKAILAVDVFGYPADYDRIRSIAAEYNLKVIEDSCEALGTEHRGKKAGTFGDAGAFGFYPNKQITTGEGGMIVTDDDTIAGLCRSMRNQGRGEDAGWLAHQRLGFNYRLSDINCAIGLAQLERIDEILWKRERVATSYNAKLGNLPEVTVPISSPDVKRSWFVYVIRLDDRYSLEDRDAILQKMGALGIGCSNYFTPIHLQPFYTNTFAYKKGDFPVTESISERTIALPFYNNLSEQNIQFVVENLNKIIKGLGK